MNGIRRSGTGLRAVYVLSMVLLGSLAAPAPSQTTAPATAPTTAEPAPPTAADLLAEAKARLSALSSAELPEETKTQATELYQQAVEQLQRAVEADKEIDRLDQRIRQAPDQLKQLQSGLASPPEAADPNVDPNASVTQLEQRLNAVEAELADARNRLDQLDAEPRHRATRRQEISRQLPTLQEQIDEVAEQLDQVGQGGEPVEVQAARRAQLRARRRALQRQVELNQRRLATYDAEVDLLPVRRDLAERQVNLLSQQRDALQQIVTRQRQAQARRQAQQAAQAARDRYQSPAVRQIAQENKELAEARTGADSPAARAARAAQQERRVEQSLEDLRREFAWIDEQAQVAGLTSDIGAALRERRPKLPDLRRIRQEIRARQEAVGQVYAGLITLERMQERMPELEATVQAELDELRDTLSPQELQTARTRANELLNDRRSILRSLISDTTALSSQLVDLNTSQRELLDAAREYTEYVNQRVLWIQSTDPLGPAQLRPALEGLAWLVNPANAAQALQTVSSYLKQTPITSALSVIGVAMLVLLHRPARRRLDNIGRQIQQQSDGLVDTLRALVLTTVSASAAPAVLLLAGWWLDRPLEAGAYSKALAAGLYAAAVALLTVQLIREILRPLGLADVHFRWSTDSCKSLRRSLAAAAVVIVPATAVVAVFHAQADQAWQDSLGRLALIVALLTAALLLYRTLRPWGPLLDSILARRESSLLHRFRIAWFLLALAGPLTLAVASAVGYHYTAVRLSILLIQTFWLCVGLLVFSAVLQRGLVLMLRRAAVRRARQRAQELQKHQAQQAEGLETPPAASVQEQEIDLGRINTQTRRMLRFVALAGLIVGVYVIWIDALPALGIFDEVRLWNTTATVSETVTTPEGETTAESVERVVPVSLADLLAAALVLIITVAAARNIPGLLEFTILQRVQLDVGVRYAAKTIVLYLIVVVGVVITFGLVGVSWGSVQWLLAAMTVGLGFGLQEIFANFVSGLIILFERPVRIGDTITVGETHGTVTRIRIRATTITDWDRKELIVPNKEFITSRLVNWTLSDKVLRVVLPVGIAYGSDTRKAEEILHRVAQEHPLVLDDPKPIILFMDFGDSALGFEARVYIAGIEHYLRVRHEMNMRIDEEFRKADITIAFPQQDVHLDSLTPVQVQLVEGRGVADVPPGAAPPPADDA